MFDHTFHTGNARCTLSTCQQRTTGRADQLLATPADFDVVASASCGAGRRIGSSEMCETAGQQLKYGNFDITFDRLSWIHRALYRPIHAV